jgi:hypothetical protein
VGKQHPLSLSSQLMAAARCAAMGALQPAELQQKAQQQQQQQQLHQKNQKGRSNKGSAKKKQTTQTVKSDSSESWPFSSMALENEVAALDLLARTIGRKLERLKPMSAEYAKGGGNGCCVFAAAAAEYVNSQKQVLSAALSEAQEVKASLKCAHPGLV